ncbi:MAG: cyclase family protein [Bacteroidales bacterium]|jgi:kynurenine formamidase|nr:cyclase family protein [Bacteroidales bacterium]
MFVDLTLLITPKIVKNAEADERKITIAGHLGTHIDVMKKIFPLDYIERKAIVFDVSNITDRDIAVSDIDIHKVKKDMCVLFYTGFIEQEKYGTDPYFTNHPQLSKDLIETLLKKEISIIEIDCAGIIRRGNGHGAMDQYCADKNVFIVENICNLKSVLLNDKSKEFIINTYPVNYVDVTGLPCRVVAKIME